MKKILGLIIFLFIINCHYAYAGDKFFIPLNIKKHQEVQTLPDKQDIKLEEAVYKTKQKKTIELNEKMVNNLGEYYLPNESIIYQENQKEIDAIDPQKQGNINSYYPGLRGPNQLIVYTPAYGLRTGTNEFGTEAIIENNMVVRLNGADSIIPKNGFVVSGHGKAKNWIMKNLQIGTKVYIDYANNQIKTLLTPDSLLFAASEKLKEIDSIVQYYKNLNNGYDDKKASECIDTSKDCLKKAKKKPEKTQIYINEAMSALDNAIKNAIPYENEELKGVWIRPVEKTPEQIVKTIERISSSGITDIFLETYFHGKTIYPSKYMKNNGVIWQRSEFVGFDPLEVWITESHKRNLKVHIWFESFYVGNENPESTPNHVLKVYPLWANKRLSNYESEEPVPSLSEHNGYFLDPANEQVKAYLLGILKEIVSTYNPDGINLDYIRYPQTVEPTYSNYANSNWGYTVVARKEFFDKYGIDPVEIKYGTSDWELWAVYRQNKISEFVCDVKNLIKDKNIVLTAVVFPDLQKSKSTKMQNWKVWSFNNYVDGLTPLILTGDKNTAVSLLSEVKKNTSVKTNIYPGLFVTFMGGPYDDLLLQIHKTREFKTSGAVIFDYAHLDDLYVNALKERVFNKSYDSKETKINKVYSPKFNPDYKPEIRYKENLKKKKKLRRKNNDNS